VFMLIAEIPGKLRKGSILKMSYIQ
jgi:hypothetical protein